ncbi:MAG: hypothetical protein EAZ51_00265 [Sphingobacteriales bacterium]|nr:MAG: hypothetical protein EAZ51_00265 [Sphingobacteriales bacterium]
MQSQKHIIKINLPGGIVSPGDLFEILNIAEKHFVDSVRFGNRQQLLFTINESQLDDIQDSFLVADVDYELNEDKYANIVSSYVTEEVLYTSNWLREGVYKDILNGFTYKPELKINLVDYYQNLIPFFTGNFNFISSDKNNFWYLYIRFPKTNTMYCWPSLVYSEDIPLISKQLEKVILTEKQLFYNQPNIDGFLLYQKIDAENKNNLEYCTAQKCCFDRAIEACRKAQKRGVNVHAYESYEPYKQLFIYNNNLKEILLKESNINFDMILSKLNMR